MAREQNGDAVLAVILAEELADIFLRDDVEADGGLVEEQHARAVQERGDEFHFHSFAEREFAHHDVEFGADFEKIDELVERGFELVGGDAVDGAKQGKRFDRGEVPPKLIFLAEDQGEEATVGVLAFGGIVTGDAGGAARRVDEAREHLEGGGLTRAVGPEEADEFALGDGERDVFGGGGLLELAFKKPFHAAPEAGDFFVGAKDAGELADFDHGWAGACLQAIRGQATRAIRGRSPLAGDGLRAWGGKCRRTSREIARKRAPTTGKMGRTNRAQARSYLSQSG